MPGTRHSDGMNADLARELATARALHARLVPRLGRRRRLGARDVLAIMRQVTDDVDALATVEIQFLIEEILDRGRHPEGRRVTREELVAAGITHDAGRVDGSDGPQVDRQPTPGIDQE